MIQNICSLAILLLLFYGRSLRHKDKKKHGRWMLVTICLDLTLVCYLVLQGALTKISGAMNPILFVHIPFAVTTVLGYLAALHVGRMLWLGRKEYIPAMRVVDRLVISTRILTFVTSVWLYLSKSGIY